MATGGLLALTALSTAQQRSASKKNERIQGQISQFNADLSRQNAELAIESSEKRAGDVRENTRALISSHRAAFGASNLVTTSGSPLLAQLKQAEAGEEAAQDVLLEGRLQAAGFSAQSSLDDFERQVGKTRGRAERRDILLSGVSQGLSTAATLRKR